MTIVVGQRARQQENFLAATAFCAWQCGSRSEFLQRHPLSSLRRGIQELALMSLDV
jgi:hypothetical protein